MPTISEEQTRSESVDLDETIRCLVAEDRLTGMSSYKKCETCSEDQRVICKDPMKKLECIRSEIQPGRFCDCLNEKQKAIACSQCEAECRSRFRPRQRFELTSFETSFEWEDEQRCAVAYYLRLEHRINADDMVRDITVCKRTGEYPVQVYLRFKAYFTENERDIIVGEWRRKYGWRTSWAKVTS